MKYLDLYNLPQVSGRLTCLVMKYFLAFLVTSNPWVTMSFSVLGRCSKDASLSQIPRNWRRSWETLSTHQNWLGNGSSNRSNRLILQWKSGCLGVLFPVGYLVFPLEMKRFNRTLSSMSKRLNFLKKRKIAYLPSPSHNALLLQRINIVKIVK